VHKAIIFFSDFDIKRLIASEHLLTHSSPTTQFW